MRTKNIVLGTIAEIIPFFILAVLGIVKTMYFISFIGSVGNGYFQFINRILSYVFLVDNGFSGAVAVRLYKPFAKDDKKEINRVYNGARVIFRRIGLVTAAVVLLAAPLLPLFNIEADFTFSVIASFLIIGGSYLLTSFFYSDTFFSLCAGNQKKYIYSTIFNIVKIVCDALSILAVIVFKSLIAVAIVILILKVIQEIIMRIYMKKSYPWLKKSKDRDYKAWPMAKQLFWHQIGYLIVNNADVILIMAFMGPIYVSIYTAYMVISQFLTEIASRINSVIGHNFGNVFAKEDKKRSKALFNESIVLFLLMAFALCIPFQLGIRSFVNLWISAEDVSYIVSYITASMFTLNIFTSIVYSPIVSIISANGLFKESKSSIMWGAFANVVLTLILLFILPDNLKIAGALGATALSFYVTLAMRSVVVSKHIFEDLSWKKLTFKYFIYTMLFVLFSIIVYPLEKLILANIHNIILLVGVLAFAFIIGSIVTLIVLYFIYDDTKILVDRVKRLLQKMFKRPKLATK